MHRLYSDITTDGLVGVGFLSSRLGRIKQDWPDIQLGLGWVGRERRGVHEEVDTCGNDGIGVNTMLDGILPGHQN